MRGTPERDRAEIRRPAEAGAAPTWSAGVASSPATRSRDLWWGAYRRLGTGWLETPGRFRTTGASGT
ncbi:hypothetical protein [Streptomyces sp. NPDC058664]|uniref:hypothetical protein n=1 Tax=unclassified Streptomyces TaxID=2593676 RepID=UPI00364F3B93